MEKNDLENKHKVNVPNLVPYLHWTPIVKSHAIRCGFKNGYQKGTCLKEIGLRAPTFETNLGSSVNIIGGTYNIRPFNEHKNLHFNNE